MIRVKKPSDQSIGTTIGRMVRLAQLYNETMVCEHNNIDLKCDPGMTARSVATDWYARKKAYDIQSVTAERKELRGRIDAILASLIGQKHTATTAAVSIMALIPERKV